MMGFNYFYGNEAEKFMFYRVPKLLFELEGLKEMSVDAKILYGMLLDRVFLSIENDWIDENGRVYIIYTVKNAMGSIGCSEKKAIKILSELERKGLIEKKRRGFGKPNLIYVKNFLTKQSEWKLQNGKYDSQRTVDNTVHDLSGLQSNDTKENNTERKNTDSEQSFKYGQEGMCDERAGYMELIRDDIGFDELIREHPDMAVCQITSNLLAR